MTTTLEERRNLILTTIMVNWDAPSVTIVCNVCSFYLTSQQWSSIVMGHVVRANLKIHENRRRKVHGLRIRGDSVKSQQWHFTVSSHSSSRKPSAMDCVSTMQFYVMDSGQGQLRLITMIITMQQRYWRSVDVTDFRWIFCRNCHITNGLKNLQLFQIADLTWGNHCKSKLLFNYQFCLRRP